MVGLVIIIIGVTLVSLAGFGREKILKNESGETQKKQASGDFRNGLLLVLLAGVLSPLGNAAGSILLLAPALILLSIGLAILALAAIPLTPLMAPLAIGLGLLAGVLTPLGNSAGSILLLAPALILLSIGLAILAVAAIPLILTLPGLSAGLGQLASVLPALGRPQTK